MSDNQLLEGIRAGGRLRRQLEGILYNQYAYLIRWGTRTHRLRPDECASAYSDTILSIIHQVTNGRFERRSTLKTYLHRVFTNKCIDLMRSHSTGRERIHSTPLPDDTLAALPDPARSIVEQLSARYDVAQLQRRLRALSSKSQAMILAWGEGYSDDEIAQQLGYASGAVAKTSRLRCLKKLQQLYDGERA